MELSKKSHFLDCFRSFVSSAFQLELMDMNDSDPFDEGQQLLVSTVVGVSTREMGVVVMVKVGRKMMMMKVGRKMMMMMMKVGEKMMMMMMMLNMGRKMMMKVMVFR